MRYALIDDGVVVNVIEASAGFAEGVQSDTAGIGDSWNGVAFTAPADFLADANTQETPRKLERALLVSRIKVTTASGKEFDGDEVSQARMARAITVLRETGTPSTPWVLADNSIANVALGEFAEALALAGAAQTALWMSQEG